MSFHYVPDLVAEVTIPDNGILSRTLHNGDRLKVVIFGFSPGQELSAHTAPMPAVLQIIQGEADLTLGEDKLEVKAGSFIHMAANLKHGIVARTPLILLLSMRVMIR